MNEVCKLLKQAGVWFLATIEDGQPRVRPFSPIHIFDGKLYFMTAHSKKVSKQMALNNQVEISAMVGEGTWIRITARTVNDDRREARAAFLEAYPNLKNAHPLDDPDTHVLYLSEAEAIVESFGGKKRIIKF